MHQRKFMEKLPEYHKLLLQFPHGISASEYAKKVGIHRTQVYDILNSLAVRGLAKSEHGIWFPNDPDSEKPYIDLVEKVLLKLSEEHNSITMEEVASKVGIPPSIIEVSVYKLVQKYGWKTAKTKLGDIKIDFMKPFDPGTLKFG